MADNTSRRGRTLSDLQSQINAGGTTLAVPIRQERIEAVQPPNTRERVAWRGVAETYTLLQNVIQELGDHITALGGQIPGGGDGGGGGNPGNVPTIGQDRGGTVVDLSNAAVNTVYTGAGTFTKPSDQSVYFPAMSPAVQIEDAANGDTLAVTIPADFAAGNYSVFIDYARYATTGAFDVTGLDGGGTHTNGSSGADAYILGEQIAALEAVAPGDVYTLTNFQAGRYTLKALHFVAA